MERSCSEMLKCWKKEFLSLSLSRFAIVSFVRLETATA